jgi:hypothetical protein
VLSDEAYESALDHWTGSVLQLGPFEVLGVEQGAIPMTDAPFPRRVSDRVFRLGAAGGATRPSTGYTFAAAQRQAQGTRRRCATAGPGAACGVLLAHLRMDALLLRALTAAARRRGLLRRAVRAAADRARPALPRRLDLAAGGPGGHGERAPRADAARSCCAR